MPPKAKFTREEIIEAALELAANKGIQALTARELGAALNSSTRPIFTVFDNMEELLGEVRNAAVARFSEYAKKAEQFTPMFKQVGLQMIMFAYEQPKLYRLLFMSERPEKQTFDDLFNSLGEVAPLCVEVIEQEYELDHKNAMMLFKQIWIYTYGVGALIATGMCHFGMEDIQDMLSREFKAMLMLIKSGRAENCTTIPKKQI